MQKVSTGRINRSWLMIGLKYFYRGMTLSLTPIALYKHNCTFLSWSLENVWKIPCDGKQESEFPSAMIAYAYPTFYWGKTKQKETACCKSKNHLFSRIFTLYFSNSFSKEMKSMRIDGLYYSTSVQKMPSHYSVISYCRLISPVRECLLLP